MGQAIALVFAVYASGFLSGLVVSWIRRIRDVA
jgi:hypothetical protein